jgi:hypothetical protein
LGPRRELFFPRTAALTKQRIHAIVGQVIDELEHRRATGKSDFVKTLADEVEKGGIAAWKALRELLPRDEDIPRGSPSMSFSQLFIAAHKEITGRGDLFEKRRRLMAEWASYRNRPAASGRD